MATCDLSTNSFKMCMGVSEGACSSHTYLIIIKSSNTCCSNISHPGQLGNKSKVVVGDEGWAVVIDVSSSQYDSGECWAVPNGRGSDWIYLGSLHGRDSIELEVTMA